MSSENHSARFVRFGVFEADLSAGELRKNGARVRLQEQPFQLLAYLLARRKFRGKPLVEALVNLPIVIPHTAAGVALLLVFGRRGLLGQWLAPLGVTFTDNFGGIVGLQWDDFASDSPSQVHYSQLQNMLGLLQGCTGEERSRLVYEELLPRLPNLFYQADSHRRLWQEEFESIVHSFQRACRSLRTPEQDFAFQPAQRSHPATGNEKIEPGEFGFGLNHLRVEICIHRVRPLESAGLDSQGSRAFCGIPG